MPGGVVLAGILSLGRTSQRAEGGERKTAVSRHDMIGVGPVSGQERHWVKGTWPGI